MKIICNTNIIVRNHTFKLSDLNGDVYGGDYFITFIDLSASWCTPCYLMAPYIDELEHQFEEENVKFITALKDVGQPYSFDDWQELGDPLMPLIINEDLTSPMLYDLFHDDSNAYPSFVLIDHTMTVRGKPHSIFQNNNEGECEGSEELLTGWIGGDTENFIAQLLDECGDLCSDSDTLIGDLNGDSYVNIVDIVTLVNFIFGGSPYSSEADINDDGTINIIDVVQLVNIILDI